MKKCRIVGEENKWRVKTKFLWFWLTEYDLVDDVYSIVTPELYGPLHAPKEFRYYVDALHHINKTYPDHQIV